jgi:hypothetical protein
LLKAAVRGEVAFFTLYSIKGFVDIERKN